MSTKRSHSYKFIPAAAFLLAVGLLAGLNVLVSALPSPGFVIGVVDDWTHHHVAFRNAGSAADALAGGRFEDWYRTVNAPRYVMQQMRRNTMSRAVMSEPDFASRMGLLNPPTEPGSGPSRWDRVPSPEVKIDWNVDVGPIGVGAGNYPAKFSFNGAASASDIAVFNTSEPGSSSAATVIGLNNLYVTSPTVAFAYNTTTGDTVASSVVFDFTGDQIAFVSTNGSHAYMNVLRFKTSSGNGTAYGSPVSPGTISTTGSGYTTCKAGAGSCLYRVEFANHANDTNSSPYYDYTGDQLWVGDNSGNIHEFTGVFNGTVAESGNPWATTSSGAILTSPVSDGSYVYAAANNGIVYSIKISSPSTVAHSAVLTKTGTGAIGINDAPLLDTTNGDLYVSTSYNAVDGASGDIRLPTPSLGTWYAVDFTGFTSGNTDAETVPSYVGSFDNTYYTSAAGSNVGYLTNCNIYGGGGLYFDPQKLSSFSTANGNTTYTPNYLAVSSGNYVCSPQIEVFNGTDDYVFFSVARSPSHTGTGAGACTNSTGCIYGLIVGNATTFTFTGTTHTVNASYYAPENTTNTVGSTSGIIVDSNGTTSHIYYTTNGASGSATCTTTTANCATQLSQSALR